MTNEIEEIEEIEIEETETPVNIKTGKKFLTKENAVHIRQCNLEEKDMELLQNMCIEASDNGVDIQEVAPIFTRDKEGNVTGVDVPDGYNITVIPVAQGAGIKAPIKTMILGLIPSLELVLTNELGKAFLANAYVLKLRKKIVDGVLSVENKIGVVYKQAVSLDDLFTASSPASSGKKDFYDMVARFSEAQKAKLIAKGGNFAVSAKNISKKGMIQAFENEAVARQLYKYLYASPALIEAPLEFNPESYFDKYLELIIKKLEKAGKPTSYAIQLKTTRYGGSVTIDDLYLSEDDEVEF